MTSDAWDPWAFRDGESAIADGRDLNGFEVHAVDGHIGKVDETSTDVGSSQIVVDTGPWIFGRKVLLPAACIERIDWHEEKVYVDRTKDQIKGSPELGEDTSLSDPTYLDTMAVYWGGTYRDPSAF